MRIQRSLFFQFESICCNQGEGTLEELADRFLGSVDWAKKIFCAMEPHGTGQGSGLIESKEGRNGPAIIEILANPSRTKHAYARTDIA